MVWWCASWGSGISTSTEGLDVLLLDCTTPDEDGGCECESLLRSTDDLELWIGFKLLLSLLLFVVVDSCDDFRYSKMK